MRERERENISSDCKWDQYVPAKNKSVAEHFKHDTVRNQNQFVSVGYSKGCLASLFVDDLQIAFSNHNINDINSEL